MESGTIERAVHIDAPPEVVFDVISSPEHMLDAGARRGPPRRRTRCW